MKFYRVRITPERARDVWRVFEFSTRHTLHDVHRAIQKSFELVSDHPYAFYMSGKHWDRASERRGDALDGKPSRETRVRLYDLGLEGRPRFSYVFDSEDELWHELELVGVTESDVAIDEPRLVESVGEAPARYRDVEDVEDVEDLDDDDDDDIEDDDIEDGDEDFDSDDDLVEGDLPDVTDLLPLANELGALFPSHQFVDDDSGDDLPGDPFDDDSGDDLPGDPFDDDSGDVPMVEVLGDDSDAAATDEEAPGELDAENLRAAQSLALKLLHALDSKSERLDALQQAVEFDLLDILLGLPLDLARHDLSNEGIELVEALTFLDPVGFQGERAVLLARAGRGEEALAQITKNLESAPGEAWAEIRAAEACAFLGDPARAEALLFAALEHAEDPDEHADALERLVELLSNQGRTDESLTLLAREQARFAPAGGGGAAAEADEHAPTLSAGPKVGRNDPCPCGSGKKHKKCCLARTQLN